MSNYPNMSYCMFENTHAALIQVLDALRDAEEKNDLLGFYNRLSHQERNAVTHLRYACEEYFDRMYTLDDVLREDN